MMVIKKKDTTTRTSAKFFRGHESSVNITGYESPDDNRLKNFEDELKEREKLKSILRRAKVAGNTDMVKELEDELGINGEAKDEDKEKTKKIEAAISEYYKLLQNPDLDDKTANRYMMIINSLNLQRPGGSNNSNQYMPPPMMYQPKSGQPDQGTQLQTMMFELMKDVIVSKKDQQLSPMEQYEKFDEMIGKRVPSLKEQLEEMKDMMKLTGQYTDGNTSLEQLKLKAEMDKTDKEFNYKKLELDLKKEQNAGLMDLGNELASAIIGGAVESLTKDEAETTETQTEKKTESKDENIHLTEQQTDENKWHLDCRRCEVSFEITDLDKEREVACTKCSWPHYFYHKTDGKYGYVGPDPNSDVMKGDPDKWLESYIPGMLEKETKIHLEKLKKENVQS